MKFKKALVTGGAGFIGSHLVDRLISMGIQVVVLDDLSVGKIDNVNSEAQFIKGSVLDEDTLDKAMDGVDVVFHEAARVTIRGSVDNFLDDAQVNLMGTLNVLKKVKERKIKRMVLASSMAVYADSGKIGIKEDYSLEPISPYGISKLASEKYCLNIAESAGFDCIILRYFNTYGTRQTFTPYVGVITIFVNELLAGRTPIIFGDGNQMRDYIYVGDIVNANICAMSSGVKQGIFNIGTGKATSVNDLAIMIQNELKTDVVFKRELVRSCELKISVPDVSKAEKILGFKAEFSIDEKLPEVISWIKSQK